MKRNLRNFAATAMVLASAATASATVYVVGDGEGIAWDPESPLALIETESNVWTGEVNSLTKFKISEAFGDWDTFNAAGLMPSEALQNNVPAPLVSGKDDILAPWKGDYSITVDLNANTITLSTNTPEPASFDVYVRGEMNGWGTSEEWKMTSTDGVTYTLGNATIDAGTKFKIADANWGQINYGGFTDIELGKDYTLVYNSSIDCTLKENLNAGTLTFNLNSKVLCVTAGSGEDSVESLFEDAAKEYFNLQGMPVAVPAEGQIYIVRSAGRTFKTVK